MKQRIRVAAIVVDDNRILMVKHVHPETGDVWWVPPGGGIEEKDDSIFDCAKRETYEETNLDIEASRVIYIREFVDKAEQELNIELFVLAERFFGDLGMQNIKGNGPDEDYIKEVDWLTKDELKDHVVYPEILKDEFWADLKSLFPDSKYLGRQVK